MSPEQACQEVQSSIGFGQPETRLLGVITFQPPEEQT
jgi:hypothetical protein